MIAPLIGVYVRTYKICIRECGSTLYVGMVHVVLFSLYIGIGMISRDTLKTAKQGYVELNIGDPCCKLTLKASDHVPRNNERTSKSTVFIFFISESAVALYVGMAHVVCCHYALV